MREGSRRTDTATVLFTDLVGSTDLRSRVGEVRADEIRRDHDELVRLAIESHRGNIVKSMGDGVMATFPGAADGVAGAIAVQRAMADHNRRAGSEPLQVRIGISCGDVAFEDSDCFGLPVVEAQRLEAAAEPGQILCSEVVRVMARGRGGHEYVDVGPLELKGFDEPVRAVVVTWIPEPLDLSAALPRMLTSAGRFAFSGRRAARERVRVAWGRAVDGRSTTALISGEPGIGKTRLVAEIAEEVIADGGIVLAGRCDEHVRVPNRPFIEALRHQLEITPPDVVAERLGPLPGELRRLVPEIARVVDLPTAPTSADPRTEPLHLLDAVVGWLVATAVHAPTMLVIDDLHWANAATLPTIRHVVERTTGSRLLLVATYRETEIDRSHPVAATLSDLNRRSDVERLALDGLDRTEVEEFLERAAEADLDESGRALAAAIHSETAGNPLFIGEVLRHLIETGQIVREGGRWTSTLDVDEIGIPDGVREVIGQRLSALSDNAQLVLSTAAVVGHEFLIEPLRALMGVTIDRVLDGLDEATGAGLVEEVAVDRYRFTHALVFSTLRDDMSATRRSRLQQKAALALGDPLARHHP